jgi:hypothetical protein
MLSLSVCFAQLRIVEKYPLGTLVQAQVDGVATKVLGERFILGFALLPPRRDERHSSREANGPSGFGDGGIKTLWT